MPTANPSSNTSSLVLGLFAGFGHQVQLIAPQYVRPSVTGNKSDVLDAHVISEAASRSSMRYVGVKTPEQQASSALHRLREARIADRVQTANQIHALLLEFGITPAFAMFRK